MDFVIFIVGLLLVGVLLLYGIMKLRLLFEKVCPACCSWIIRTATKCPRCHTLQANAASRTSSSR
jgi:hypothetical protein